MTPYLENVCKCTIYSSGVQSFIEPCCLLLTCVVCTQLLNGDLVSAAEAASTSPPSRNFNGYLNANYLCCQVGLYVLKY